MLQTKNTKLQIKLPAGWHEVSFNKAFEIITQERNPIEIISILSGHSVSLLKASTDLETIYYLKESLLFLNSDPIKKYPEFPVSFMGKLLPWVNYADKFDLAKCSVGQVEDMQAQIQKVDQDDSDAVIQVFPVIVAIYIDPIYHQSDYDFDRAMKLVNKVEEQDYKTVVNMASFFLMRLVALSDGLKKGWPSQVLRRLKLKQGLMNLVQRLVSMLP